jgi:hypothetical protein
MGIPCSYLWDMSARQQIRFHVICAIAQMFHLRFARLGFHVKGIVRALQMCA